MGKLPRIVVVGHGMVGHRFCERLIERGGRDRFEITVLAEEPHLAYDRVHLSEFFSGKGADDLTLADADWYQEQGIDLRLGQPASALDRTNRVVRSTDGGRFAYDWLVLATGSAPFVPPLPGADQEGVFVYRTLEDLEAIQRYAGQAQRAAVIGGGLLGLEAAKATQDLGLDTSVVEFADRLMPRQVDADGGELLRSAIESLGVRVCTDARTEALVGQGGRVSGLAFSEGDPIEADLVVISAGIRPRDELARGAGLDVGERGGVLVDDTLTTSDPHVLAIGECALHRGAIYGLVAPGYEMADIAAQRILGESVSFEGADMSTKLKLLGVDVASFGDPFATGSGLRSVILSDRHRGVYQKLLVDAEKDCLKGGILVGDAQAYSTLLDATQRALPLPERLEDWLFAGEPAADDLDDAMQVCTCNDVTAGQIRQCIADEELTSVGAVKACTRAGTGCGGCMPTVTALFERELERSGREVNRSLCEHFPFTRQELFWKVKLGRIESFDVLLAEHGTGDGCEVCRPAVASILAATWNDLVTKHAEIQDTNDRFLANIQRGGTYSVIPRVPGGEITPEKLIVLGQVAKKHDLYCKITGGQRIDLLGARVDQLPEIWEELVAAGFESGHAYGKAMRTVKSCIGSTWCRYGQQDSTSFAIRVEERYRGLRAPHKLKSAVSGCIRECAEAQNKDFGIIATENGWNVYLCGNGGSNPRHGDLVATDIIDDEVIALIDRFLMFYIQTAKPLQRTARWLEELDGGIETLKQVILEDSLGVCDQLEADMQQLVDSYQCEWKSVVENPDLREGFRHFATSDAPDDALSFLRERGQKRPTDWADEAPPDTMPIAPESDWSWTPVGEARDFPKDGGRVIRHGTAQIAVFHFARRDEWYATQNLCPHRKDMVLARGMLGSQGEEPKVACPMHKKTFSLRTGKGLADPNYSVKTFPVEIRDEQVYVKLPPAEDLERAIGCGRSE